MAEVGITKVADVTGLDRVGIPNFMSVRPRDSEPGISYYNGKGTTRADAHAGALMEAIERHAAEACEYKIVIGSFAKLKDENCCISPSEIIVPQVRECSDDLVLEWIAGYDLLNDRETLVPLNTVLCPYCPKSRPVIFFSSSNGLASGNTRQEALCHALCEIIERDAQAMVMARLQLRPAIQDLLESHQGPAVDEPLRVISLKGLPRRATKLVKRLRDAGLSVYLRDLTGTSGIATIDCTIVSEDAPTSSAYGGCGCHPDARVALLRAITEAAQSRLTCIQGGREDLPQILSRNRSGEFKIESIFGKTKKISFREIPSYKNLSIDEDLEVLLRALPASGLDRAIAFDLTRREVGIPVVRVIVPRAETWTVFHLHTGRAAIGPRISEVLCQ